MSGPKGELRHCCTRWATVVPRKELPSQINARIGKLLPRSEFKRRPQGSTTLHVRTTKHSKSVQFGNSTLTWLSQDLNYADPLHSEHTPLPSFTTMAPPATHRYTQCGSKCGCGLSQLATLGCLEEFIGAVRESTRASQRASACLGVYSTQLCFVSEFSRHA